MWRVFAREPSEDAAAPKSGRFWSPWRSAASARRKCAEAEVVDKWRIGEGDAEVMMGQTLVGARVKWEESRRQAQLTAAQLLWEAVAVQLPQFPPTRASCTIPPFHR